MPPKTKAEIVQGLTEDLARDEENQLLHLTTVDLEAVNYDEARKSRGDLEDEIGAIEADIRSEVNREAYPAEGKAPLELSNETKRNDEIRKRLAPSEAYAELNKRKAGTEDEIAVIQRKIDSANRWVRHYGARMANRRAVLTALGGNDNGG